MKAKGVKEQDNQVGEPETNLKKKEKKKWQISFELS